MTVAFPTVGKAPSVSRVAARRSLRMVSLLCGGLVFGRLRIGRDCPGGLERLLVFVGQLGVEHLPRDQRDIDFAAGVPSGAPCGSGAGSVTTAIALLATRRVRPSSAVSLMAPPCAGCAAGCAAWAWLWLMGTPWVWVIAGS